MTVRTGSIVNASPTFDSYPRGRRGVNMAAAVGDATPPVLAIVSPTPGVQPGAAGGFPANYQSAKNTPVILQVTDADGATNVQYVAIVATFTYADGTRLLEPVYRRGNFVGNYVAQSSQASIANGIQLTCQRLGGWPGTSGIMPMQFDIDALDKGGNLT